MSYFSTRALHLFPSYALKPEKEKELDIFLQFLDRSEVGDLLISDDLNWNKSSCGRPNINIYSLFATILYSFTFDKGTLRDISSKCEYDLRYMYLMNGVTPSFKTIGNFINHFILPNIDAIFTCLTKKMIEELDINTDTVYIDGTKIEADANKYKFVWKPTTFHKRLCTKIRNLLELIKLADDLPDDEIFSSEIIADKLSVFGSMIEDDDKVKKKQYDSLFKYLEKAIEYEEKEEICGPDRNSYYKTDHDATAMTLKTDYYSGLGSSMHAAYNVQIVVANSLIVERIVSQNRNDISDFINVIETFYKSFGRYPESVCADAGYGSFQNYRYLDKKRINSYVKSQSWQGNISGRNPDSYRVLEDGSLICLNGNYGYKVEIENRHPKKRDSVFYRVNGCNDCLFNTYCKRWQKIKDEDYKIFEVDVYGSKLKRRTEENLLSKEGIIKRVNRSIQVEGAFGSIKYNLGYNRFRRTNLDKVKLEFTLTILGYNFRKFFKYIKGENIKTEWRPSKDIKEEIFKKPSAKRLRNKILKRKTKSENQKAKDNYKYKSNRKRGGKT